MKSKTLRKGDRVLIEVTLSRHVDQWDEVAYHYGNEYATNYAPISALRGLVQRNFQPEKMSFMKTWKPCLRSRAFMRKTPGFFATTDARKLSAPRT